MLPGLSAAKALTPARALKGIKKLRSVKTAFERIDSEWKLHQYKIREYQPNIRMRFERGHFIVKTAESGAELKECLKLRYEVFHREYKNKKREIGVDIDSLDYICDHLVIVDKRISKVIGTYRMNSSLFSDTFYSENEFHIQDILKLEGNKLELGRACIDREHRNGVVISLLWRGIAQYIQLTETKVLFGCASVKTMEPLEIGLLTKHLNESGAMDLSLDITPTKKYKVRQLDRVLEYIEQNPFEYRPDEVEELIPTLLKSYIRAGVKVCGEPAIDREFRCIDYLIVLKVDEMSATHKEKYHL